MKKQGNETNREGRRKSVRQRKCQRVSGDRTTCSKNVEIGGRPVSDTIGEEAAVKTVDEQQLIEDMSYADAVVKGKRGNCEWSRGILLSGRWTR